MNGSHSQFVHDICVLTNKSWFTKSILKMAHSLRIPLRILQTIKGYKGKVVWKVLIWSWFGCVLCKWQTSGMWPLIKNTLNSHILTYELSNVLFIRWNLFVMFSSAYKYETMQAITSEWDSLSFSAALFKWSDAEGGPLCHMGFGNHYYSDLSHSVQSEQQS